MKYLGFFLKPNAYVFKYWIWLYKKFERILKLKFWVAFLSFQIKINKFLLEANLVYWYLSYIIVGIFKHMANLVVSMLVFVHILRLKKKIHFNLLIHFLDVFYTLLCFSMFNVSSGLINGIVLHMVMYNVPWYVPHFYNFILFEVSYIIEHFLFSNTYGKRFFLISRLNLPFLELIMELDNEYSCWILIIIAGVDSSIFQLWLSLLLAFIDSRFSKVSRNYF